MNIDSLQDQDISSSPPCPNQIWVSPNFLLNT